MAVMLRQIFSSFFHFQQQPGRPEKIGELRSFSLVDAKFQSAAGFHDAGVPECLEKTVAKDLGFAFLVTLDVLADEGNELGDLGGLGCPWLERFPFGKARRSNAI